MKKQNNTAMAHSAKPHKKRPFRLLALLAMMALAPALWAQDPVYPNYDPAYVNGRPEWDGRTTTGDFKITGEITVDTYLSIGTGNTLKLFPMKTPNGPQPTIIKKNSNDNVFWLHGEGKLFIIGNEDNILNFYGNCGNGTATNPTPIPTQTTYQGSAIYCESGTPQVWLKYVEFYGFVTHTDIRPYPKDDSQGGIVTMGHHQEGDANGVCNMDHVTFRDNFGGPINTNSDKGFGRIISFVNDSWTVTLDNVTIRDCIISEKLHNNHYSIGGMGSAIRSQGNVGGSLTMRNCVAYNNTYRDLSAKPLNQYTSMSDIKAQPLSGQGGVINWRSGRKNGDGDARVEIKDCYFHHNSARCGGAVATCANIKLENTKIWYNEAEQGGGVYFYTYNGGDALYDGHGFRAIFDGGVDIWKNSATEYGGGAYLTFDASNDVGFNPSQQAISPEFSLNINGGSTIHHNKAPKGAGIALMDGCPYSHYNNKNNHNNIWSLEYQRTVNLNGGKIYDNYAQGTTGDEIMAGGGLYIEKYEYSSGHPLVGFHTDYTNNSDPDAQNNSGTLTVNLASGEVYNNSAGNDTIPGTGYGGGVYIASNFMTNTIKSTLNVNIGEVGKDLQMYKNQAYTDGGGVYVWYDREDNRKNNGTVTVEGGTIGRKKPVTDEIEGNKALTRNGGGICVMGGTVVVKGGKIEYNTADTGGGGLYVSVPNKESITTIQGTASISYNTANNGNGGGVCLDKGRINIYGSDISDNKATKGNGGGLYIQEGDIFVWPNEMLVHPNAPVISQCEATKTTVLNNTAGGNGGGLNTHRGRFDVRFAEINNNTAGYNYSSVGTNGGNGGGLFCDGTDHDNGYTVRLLHCDLEENKAFGNVYEGEGITGRGGGVYLKHGSIFAEHCDIIKNEADINGGGLDNHSGELRVYGSYIDENVAHEGRGGGLYTEEGNIVVGPCDTYGYKDSKASRIIKNKAKINGGGINNHRGDITIHGDRINENVAETGHGGGVYINSGNIYMYGGQINNNKADKGKGGGVYGGGGKFNIMERKANPIVEIIEVEDIKATEFNVHYHLVDRGLVPVTVSGEDPNYTYSDPGNLTHGISYIKNGEAWADSSYVEYNSESHLYVLRQGCVRIPLTSLSASQLYHVKAYAKYSHNGVNYFDASPVIQIATTGAKPVVATGEASEITQNSAKVTGKLFYKGDNDEGVVTQGIRYRIGEGGWTNVASTDTEAEFSVTLTGLAPGTIYEAQAYAMNGENTGNGVTITFTTATGSKAPQGPRSVYPAVEENPFFMELTPLQQAIMASTPEADSTTAAPATPAKTHRDDPQPQGPENIPEINNNSAMFGGGICIDLAGAELVFAGSREANPDKLGQINKNYASEAGGGIYIGYQTEGENPGPAMMQMMGKCEVNRNRVPEGKHGGGIYLDGRFYVGDKDTDLIGTHGLKVDKNFAINKDQATFETELDAVINGTALPEVVAQYGVKTMNNVFLPRNDYNYYEHDDAATTETYNKVSVITLLSDVSGYAGPGETNPHSHIGFSVLNGFCPVIATSDRFGGDYNVHTDYDGADPTHGSELWLYNLMQMNPGGASGSVEAMRGAVFEDSESYVAIHTRKSGDGHAPFRWKYIYLWGCWTHPIVRNDPETLNPMSQIHGYEEAGEEEYFLGHYKIKNPGDYTGNTENGTPTGTTALEWEIYSPEGLAWFTSYVNGLNVFDESGENHKKDANDPNGEYHFNWTKDQNPKAIATIMNDLDMSAFLWVPIGSVQKFYLTSLTSEEGSSLFVDSEKQVMEGGYTKDAHYYRGTFDGQGHIIKGLQGLYLTGIEKFGLFGYLADDAVVKNTFVDKGLFVSDNEGVVYSAGGITGTMKLRPEDALDEGEKNGKVPVISNSEARMDFNAYYSDDGSHVGGIVGDLQAGHVHSCMAMPNITTAEIGVDDGEEQYVGGLVGYMKEGTTVRNSFANVLFVSKNPKYRIGGIVSENHGIIENVYVRYNNADNTPDLPNDKFCWVSGYNYGTIKFGFAPEGKIGNGTNQWWYGGASVDGQPNTVEAQFRRSYGPTNLVDNKYGFAHDDQKAEPYGGNGDDLIPKEGSNYLSRMTYDATTHETYFNGLVGALNNWVEAVNDTSAIKYTPWTRTMASTINDDYPVLMFNDFNVVGTEDGIYMKYDDNVNDMWKKPNYESTAIAERTGKNFQNLTAADNPKAAMYLYKTNGVTANNTNPVAINVTDNTAVPLHIHQNIGITQATVNDELTARVGVTFDNTDFSIDLGGEKYDWHMFSSALKAAPLGITYRSDNKELTTGGKDYIIKKEFADLQVSGITDDNYRKRDYMDPPVIEWNTEEGTVGYFPTNTPYGKWGNNGHWPSSGDFSNPTVEQPYSFDFYCFHEPSRHWINFKREGTPAFMDHWHQDIDGSGKHQNLRYENESTLQRGKGYMMGVSATSMLMADGILNNGQVKSQEPLSNSLYGFNMSGYSEDLRGINLVGNPYQSYLNFTDLARATENAGIIYSETYYLFDADAKRYISYTAGASDNKQYAPRYIHPHQGFFIKTANNESQLTFTNAMRKETGDPSSYFRGQDLNYPLVNLFCYDGDGHYDLTTVEMNRPELGGGEKLKDMRFGNSLLYASMDDADYQTLFAPEGTSTVAVRFKASQNGVYTLRWETMHGDFQHLHLIDNLAGVDVDCMRQSEYRFEASTTDYLSRFKLVFDVTDVEENADEAESATFAFQMGDELVVNGSGELSVFDIQGRCIASQRLAGTQSSISLPRAASGMYILRLTGDKQVKTQKLIIK